MQRSYSDEAVLPSLEETKARRIALKTCDICYDTAAALGCSSVPDAHHICAGCLNEQVKVHASHELYQLRERKAKIYCFHRPQAARLNHLNPINPSLYNFNTRVVNQRPTARKI